MIVLLMGLLGAYQSPTGQDLVIWEQLAEVEVNVRKKLIDLPGGFGISNNDPVRGYYVDRVGVVILVPTRYRASTNPMKDTDEKLKDKFQESIVLEKGRILGRMKEWQEQIKKREMLKEADFENLVANLKQMIPDILGSLTSLPVGDSLTLIIEERVPAWFFSGLSLNKNPSRKVVTLTVSKDLIADIHAESTELPGEWLKRVKRSTAKRSIESSVIP